MQTIVHKVARGAVALLYPPRCLSCNALTHASHTWCGECYPKLRFLAKESESQLKAERGFLYGESFSLLAYNSTAKQMVAHLKFNDGTELAKPLANMLADEATFLLDEADYIFSIPLSKRRLFRRKYNQAALLAQQIAKRSGKPFSHHMLVRTLHTPPQMGLNRTERMANLQDAFAVLPKYQAELKGKTVVLVDDVITTGATVSCAAKALSDVGVRVIHVVSLAKTLRQAE